MSIQKITAVTLLAALSLSACSTSSNSKLDYKSQVKGSPLEVPPGLTDYDKNKQFDLSNGVRASAISGTQPASAIPAGQLLVSAQDMRIEKSGESRWLVVNRPAEQVWPVLQEFWEENGFTIRNNSLKLGTLETDWAENRAALPESGLRKILGKALDSLYETGMRDMFKTRIERTSNGTEIYISHRGMEEVYTSSAKDATTWQPRAADPQLEAEFLSRLMVRLGTNEKEAKAALQNSINTSKGAEIVGETLVVSDNMENTWRRIGLSLDRVGLSVIDRDYTSRIYFVTPSPDDRGLFRKSFGKLNENYQVRFKTLASNKVEVSFADQKGGALSDSALPRVLKNLQKALK
ncbi:MAG: outer membrane protein assembly factor BamC [Formosimonas sp.]